MPNLIYVVSTLSPSGPTNQLICLIKKLDRKKFSIFVITLSRFADQSLVSELNKFDITVLQLNLSRLGGLFFGRRYLSKIISKQGPVLLHTQGFRPDLIASGLNFKGKKISTIHNYPQLDYVMTYGVVVGWLLYKIHIAIMGKFDLLIGCSKSVAENLSNKFNLANVTYIQNGIDCDKFNPVRNNKNFTRFRAEIGLDSYSRVWIVLGHLTERKDPIFLINAWISFMSESHDDHLVFVGDGRLKATCEEISSKVKNIHFLGSVNNPSEYLKISDFYVSASLSEGLPLSALEAMATGLPILMSDISPHKEIFSSNLIENFGFLFKLNDENDFYLKLCKLLKSDYEVLSSASRNAILENFSADKMALSYSELYYRILYV